MCLAGNRIPGKIQFTYFCSSQSLDQLIGVKHEKVKNKNSLLSQGRGKKPVPTVMKEKNPHQQKSPKN